MSDNEDQAEDDLESIPTGIPIERMRAAVEALNLPSDASVAFVDPSTVPLWVVITDGGDQWRIHASGTMDRREAIAALRELADRWDLDEMGVSDD